MLNICRVSSQDDIIGIKTLQQLNLKHFLEEEEVGREGFVTAEYTLEYLKLMNDLCPSIIAKDGSVVVGYALVAVKEIIGNHELLDNLFEAIDQRMFNGVSLRDVPYVIVGQLCVAKGYRRNGLACKMYDFYRTELRDQFQFAVTDVDRTNPRSLKAHVKAGFQVIDTLVWNESLWDIVLWDWTC